MNYVQIFAYVMSLFTGISRSNPDAMGLWKEYMVYCTRALSRKLNYGERFDALLKASEMKDGDHSRNFVAFGIECIAHNLGDSNPILEQELYARSSDFVIPVGSTVELINGETPDGHFYVEDRKINGIFKVDQPNVAVIHISAREYLLQQDLKKQYFILQLQTRAQGMIKAGKKLTDEDMVNFGVIGTINCINDTIAKNLTVRYAIIKGLGDCLVYTAEDGSTKVLTTVYYPWAGNNKLADLLKNKSLHIHYVETYNSSQDNETLVICGEFE